ncbi:MAG: Pycsar system effector family protein, partial [Sphingobium sp.]
VGDDANILFFGIFTSVSESEFADRIVAKLDDDEALYRVMLRDIYQNGQVLQHKKYKYLGYAYRIFLTGLVLSFAAFAVELVLGRLI